MEIRNNDSNNGAQMEDQTQTNYGTKPPSRQQRDSDRVKNRRVTRSMTENDNNDYYYLAGRSLGNNILFEGVNAL